MMSDSCSSYDHAFCDIPACDCRCHVPQQEKIVVLDTRGASYAMPEEWAKTIASFHGESHLPTEKDLIPYMPPGGSAFDVQYFRYGSAPEGFVFCPGKLRTVIPEEKPQARLNGGIGKYILGKMQEKEATRADIEDWIAEAGLARGEAALLIETLCKHGDIYESGDRRYRAIVH